MPRKKQQDYDLVKVLEKVGACESRRRAVAQFLTATEAWNSLGGGDLAWVTNLLRLPPPRYDSLCRCSVSRAYCDEMTGSSFRAAASFGLEDVREAFFAYIQKQPWEPEVRL